MKFFSKKIFYRFFLYIFIFWLFAFVFVSFGHKSLVIAILVPILIFAARNNINYLVTFFVYFLSLSSIVGTDNNLFMFIGLNEVTQLGILYYLLSTRRQKTHLPKMLRYIQYLIFILFLYHIIFSLKSVIIPGWYIENVKPVSWIFKRTFKLLLNYIPLILLVNRIWYKDLSKYIIPGMILSALIIVASMPISDFLNDVGFTIGQMEFDTGFKGNQIIRAQGFYGAGGDVNSAGFFLVVMYTFVLIIVTYLKKNSVIMFVSSLIIFAGIILTASRTAILSLGLVVVLYMLFNKQRSANYFKVIVFFIFSIIVFFPIFNSAIERFFLDSAVTAIDVNQLGRIGKWILYYEYFVANGSVIIFGYIIPIRSSEVPHNVMINMLYNGGLIIVAPFLIYLIKIFQKIINKNESYILFLPFIPFFGAVLSVNTPDSLLYLWLIIPMLFKLTFRNTKLRSKNNLG